MHIVWKANKYKNFNLQTLKFKWNLVDFGLINSSDNVATLALGSRTGQGIAKVRAESEAQESHFMLMGV